MMATRLGVDASVRLKSISNRAAMSAAKSRRIASRAIDSPGRWKIVRCMKVPPEWRVECWSSDTMLAPPAPARNVLTADTRPGGRSAQRKK